jgi:hypothetical protein
MYVNEITVDTLHQIILHFTCSSNFNEIKTDLWCVKTILMFIYIYIQYIQYLWGLEIKYYGQ